MELRFGLYGIIVAVLIGAFGVVQQAARARQIDQQFRGRLRRLSAHVRQVGRETLKLKRLKRTEEERRRALAEQVEAQAKRLREIRQSAAPLVVFDERKTMGDRMWRIPVLRATAGVGMVPWRNFLVWAPTPERAVHKLRARYASTERYAIGEAEERHQMPPSA